LRVPERRQMAMVVQCPDDWVAGAACGADGGGAGGDPGCVGICRAHQGARGSGGSRRHRSGVTGGVVVVCLYTGDRIGAGVARRCEESAAFRWLCGE